MTRPYTAAQLRAMQWLPSDGSWRMKPGKTTSALNSLSIGFGKLVESEWGDFGPCGGLELRWRLTEAGIAAKKAIGPEDHG